MENRISEIKPLKILKFGDHIKVPRLNGIYYHHGVYIGNSNVLHLTGNPKRGLPSLSYGEGMASVKIDDIDTFENGVSSIIVKSATKDLDKVDFLSEVYTMVNKDKEYNLVVHNCEHFANSITQNEMKSGQVTSAWYATSFGGIASMIGMYTLHTITGTILVPILVTSASFIGLQLL